MIPTRKHIEFERGSKLPGTSSEALVLLLHSDFYHLLLCICFVLLLFVCCCCLFVCLFCFVSVFFFHFWFWFSPLLWILFGFQLIPTFCIGNIHIIVCLASLFPNFVHLSCFLWHIHRMNTFAPELWSLMCFMSLSFGSTY